MLKEKSETGGWSMPNDARLLIDSVYSEMADSSIPDGLQSATIRAQGLQQAQVGMGHLNALILKKGYCRDAVQADQWNEDDKIQTRLSEESREIVLAVYIDGILSPYADLENHAWDWSTLSVSQAAWNQNNYSILQEYIAVVEELKKQTPRLKYSDVVIVNERSTTALSSNKSISNHYSPRFGWGAPLNEEE
jgi:CRISPR-associated endonuclease/helicase Cas3